MTLPSVADDFGKLDNDSSLWRWSQSVLGSCGPGYTSHSHTSFLGQCCLCVHTTANCSAWNERGYFWWQVVTGPGIAFCPALVILTDVSLVVQEGSIQTTVSLKQPHIALFKLGSGSLFVFIHQAVARVISWNFSLWSLQSVRQNLDIEECDWGALLDVLPSLSLITDETKEFRLYHGMSLFIRCILKGHSSFAGPLELRSPFCRCLLIAVLLRRHLASDLFPGRPLINTFQLQLFSRF